MEFPEDVLRIIKEYSMPVTRSDWRICGKINKLDYMREFKKVVMQRHLRVMSCNHEEYVRVYRTYKTMFTIRNYDITFHSL
jgi:hypothetical protein